MKPTLMYFHVTKKKKKKKKAQSCHALVKDSLRIQPPLITLRRETSSSARRASTQALEREQERMRALFFLAHISLHYCFFFA